MKVSNRLYSVSLLVHENEKIIDIGCDHGLLDIYLTLNKKCICSCCDVSPNIVFRAVSNISKYHLLDSINVFVGNGYNDLKLDYDSVMILAGMGTATILKILEKNKTNNIICQTNTDLYLLRKTICEMGYFISNENITFENNRYYITIRFTRGNSLYSYDELLLGPILLQKKDSLFHDYVVNLYNKNINGYNKSFEYGSDSFKELRKMIYCLKKYI